MVDIILNERAAWELMWRLGRMPTSHAVLDGYTALAELALLRHDEARSPTARRRARRRARRACTNLRVFALVFGIGAPARWLYGAELHWRSGRRAHALRAWRRGLAAAERLDMRHEQALAHAALGDRLPAGSAAAERHRARGAELLLELGAMPALRAVTPSGSVTGPVTGSLTRRLAPALDELVASCRARRSRAGYLAAVLTHLPTALDAALQAHQFDHPEAVVALHVALVERYCDAWRAYERGAPCPRAWTIAFATGARREPHLIEQLRLGLNAQVALDLPLSLAEAVGRERMTVFGADFERCGTLLDGLVEATIADLAGSAVTLDAVARRIGGGAGGALDLRAARARAWRDGDRLAALAGDARGHAIATLDTAAAQRAEAMAAPVGGARRLALAIRVSERATVTQMIDDLRR